MPLLSCGNQIIILFLGIISAVIYDIYLHKSFTLPGKIVNIYSTFEREHVEEFYSSVSCRGTNHTDRQCMFENLCYDSVSDSFIFFHSVKSIIIGLPQDRFSPALTDFSSVYDHNTQYFNFIDLPESALLSFNVSSVNGISLILKRFNPDNLMHVFHDDLIPSFITVNEIFLLNDRDVQFVFADERKPGPYAYLYDNFFTKKPLYLNYTISATLCFEKAIVGLNKNSLWYQYGFRQPQGSLNKDMSLIFPILMHFRKFFYNQFSLKETDMKDTALLVSRGHNRKILNAESIAKVIESRTNLKTYLVSLEKYSVIDIIKEIMSCKLVIGMHGSLLILLLFLPPKSHVIELFPYAVNPDICTPYRTLVQIPGLGITYHSWENKIEKNSFPHPEYSAELGGISHLPEDKQEAIKKSVVKPFLCCYNPEWLYRIYQDTIVDLYSLSDVITTIIKEDTVSIKSNFVNNRLYPSEVQNISCKLSATSILFISWSKPWNVDFINATTVEYELWYQDNENEVKAFIMKKTYFMFKEIVSKNTYVWIRCHVDGRIGPFNTNPLVCVE